MSQILSDDALLSDIKAGGVKREQAIAAIYQDQKLKNQVIAFVRNSGGSSDDGLDLFHEGIIALDDNIRKDKYERKGNLQAYLFAICRFMWFNRLKKNRRTVLTEEPAQFDGISLETPECLSLDKEQKQILDQLLGRLGEKCEKILTLWKLSYSMEEIAERVALKNAGVARRQKYNCYEKLLQIVDQEPSLRSVLK